jgi:hypothetical protein
MKKMVFKENEMTFTKGIFSKPCKQNMMFYSHKYQRKHSKFRTAYSRRYNHKKRTRKTANEHISRKHCTGKVSLFRRGFLTNINKKQTHSRLVKSRVACRLHFDSHRDKHSDQTNLASLPKTNSKIFRESSPYPF